MRLTANRLTSGWVLPPTGGPLLEKPWKVMLVFTHPLKSSYCAALADEVRSSLTAQGHLVDFIDLYNYGGEGQPFQAALTPAEREHFFDGVKPPHKWAEPPADTAPLIDKVRTADALVFVYPCWWMSMPAILKGFFDRVYLFGVALVPGPDGKMQAGGLPNVKRVAAVCTYQAPRIFAAIAGDSGHSLIGKIMLGVYHKDCSLLWKGIYDMDNVTAEGRAAFLKDVRATFATWLPPVEPSAAAAAAAAAAVAVAAPAGQPRPRKRGGCVIS